MSGQEAMARIRFTVTRTLPHPPVAVFTALTDWPGHERWVPVTRVVVHAGDGGVGTEFTATTGVWPLALPDRMRVTDLDPQGRQVTVVKVGPVLGGEVRIGVTEGAAGGSLVVWDEDLTVPRVPAFLGPLIGGLAAVGFRVSLARLDRFLHRS